MNKEMSLLKPARLREDSTIGIFTPSEPVDPELLDRGIASLHSMGFKVIEAPNTRNRKGHLAGSDIERATDLNTLFADKNVDAIFCSAGGANSARLLSLIDEEVVLRNPKIILGVSDPSSLLIGLYARTGLVTFHGPAVQYDFGKGLTQLTIKSFKATLIEGTTGPLPGIDAVSILKEGRSSGRLIAGNLSTIVQLIGTPWEPNWNNAILCWEDVCEQPHALDARLTHLRNTGILEQLSGMIVGELVECEEQDYPGTATIEEILIDHLAGTNYPVLWGLPFGHTADKVTIPIGVKALIDTSGALIVLEETYVR